MSPLWYLPSVVLGLFYALSNGNWFMLASSLATFALTFVLGRRAATIPEGELRIVGNRVWLGDKRLPKRQLFWSKRLNSHVFEKFAQNRKPSGDLVRALTSSGWFLGERNSFLVGVDRAFNISEGAGHLLVIGPTGSGKSELIHLALASLDPKVQVALADYKGGAVLTEASPALSTSDLETPAAQASFWQGLLDELVRRELLLRAQGFAAWEQSERQGGDQERLLVVVDELVAAIRGSVLASETVIKIATKGRSLGVHLLVTSQSLVGIPREVLINLRSRLALSGVDEVELLQMGCKEKFSPSGEQTKAAMLLHDGQTFRTQVPLGARRVPRQVA